MMAPTSLCPIELPTPSATPSFIVCKKEGLAGVIIAGRFLLKGIGVVVIFLDLEGLDDLGILY